MLRFSRILSAAALAFLTTTLTACPEDEPTPSTPVDAGSDIADATADQQGDGTTTVTELDLSAPVSPGEARAGLVAKTEDLLTGPKADGRIGDVKMVNAKAAFIIENIRRTDGYRYYGGNAVDMVVLNADGSQATEDRFGELIHTWNLLIFEPSQVEVINDGRSGGDAHVRVTGKASPFVFADSFIRTFLNPEPADLEIVYDYILEPDAQYLKHEVRVYNLAAETANVDPPAVFASQGDGYYPFKRGDGFANVSGPVDYMAFTGSESAVGLMTRDTQLDFAFNYSNVLISLETGFSVPAGGFHIRTYFVGVSNQGHNGLDRIASDLGIGAPKDATIQGTVTLPESVRASLRARATVSAWQGSEPMTYGSLNEDGSFELVVAPGDYRVEVHIPDHASPTPVDVTAATGQSATADFNVTASASLTVSVVDGDNNPVDARIMAIAAAGSSTPSPYPPEAMDTRGGDTWEWNDGGFGRVSAVGYAVTGSTTVTVPPGTYEIQATRGMNYTVDTATVTVTAGEAASASLTIDKVVDTNGTVSGDFHIHALRSPDSNVPWDIRVLQSVTVEMDAPPLTEHVTLASFGPAIERKGLIDWLIPIPGQEVTTFEFGHFNAFPLEFRPGEPNNGGVFPYDKNPTTLFDAIRNQGTETPFIQVNHPRGSAIGGYFDWVGFDVTTGLAAREGDEYSTNFDGIEVFNGSCGLGEEFDDWVAMTNLGWRKTLSSGSDSHDESKVIGLPRQVTLIEHQTVRSDLGAYADALRARKTFVTCGPFVRFETADGAAGMGDMTTVDASGEVAFRVQVSAPSWQQLVEVRVLRNGELIDVLPIDEVANGVRLDVTVTDTPTADAWYMVHVVGAGNLLPVYDRGSPSAFTNPIEVDADGDGTWTPPGL